MKLAVMNSFGITIIYVGVIIFGTMLTIVLYGVPEYICISIQLEAQLWKKPDESYDSSAYKRRFIDPGTEYDTSISFYLYNISNPVNLSSYEEVGPYVYNITRNKTILDNMDNDYVAYKEKSFYFFNSTASGNLADTDELNVLDIPALTLVALCQLPNLPPYDNISTLRCLEEQTMFKDLIHRMNESYEECLNDYKYNACDNYVCRTTVKDILFNGFKTPSSCIISKVHIGLLELLVNNLSSVVNLHTDPRPLEFDDEGKFAFYNQKNGSDYDTFRVDTGRKNSNNIGTIQHYRGLSELIWFDLTEYAQNESVSCNQILGTDGTIFPPFLDENQNKTIRWVFMPELCRSFKLFLESLEDDCKVQVVTNMFMKPEKCYRYAIDNSTFSTNDDIRNSCFCKTNSFDDEKNNGRAPIGTKDLCNAYDVMPIIKCKYGAPLYLSKPRYRYASKSEKELNKTDNFGHFIIEPHSGVLMEMAKSFQVNIAYTIQNDSTNSTILHPLLWYYETVSLNPGRANFLAFSAPQNIWYYTAWGFVVAFVIIIAGFIASLHKDPFEVSYSDSLNASDRYVGRPHVD